MSSNLKDGLVDQFFMAVGKLKTLEEFYMFFEDVCTVSELKALAQRMQVAKMVSQGSTYDDIVSKTGASTATIARVKRCFDYGSGGYKLVLSRIEGKKDDKK